MNLHSISVLLKSFTIIVLINISLALPAHAACSSYAGKASINEFNMIGTNTGTGTDYIELKILDSNLLTSTSDLTGWKLRVFRNSAGASGGTACPGGGCVYFDTDVNALINGVYNNTANDYCQGTSGRDTYIRVPFASNALMVDSNVLLLDNLGNVVDLFRITNGNNQSNLQTWWTKTSSCSSLPFNTAAATGSFPLDTDLWNADANRKNIQRLPDGIGPWVQAAGNGANSEDSLCTTNDSLLAITKTPSSPTVGVGSGSTFTWTIQVSNGGSSSSLSNVTISDTIPANMKLSACPATVTCTGTAPDITAISKNVGTLAAGASASITLTAYMTAVGTYSNTATATATELSPGFTQGIGTVSAISVTPPTITSNAATSIGSNSVTLNGTITSDGGAASTGSFGYSTTSGSYTSSCSPVSGTGSVTGSTFSCTLTGLSSCTTYYFRASGTNSAGTTNAGELSFTTRGCSFNAYETTLVPSTAKIYTKLASTPFSLKVAAMNGTTIQTSYTGTNVTVDLISGSAACAAVTSALTGVSVSPTSHDYVTGDNGVYTYSFTSSNAYANAKVRIKYDGTAISCSSDNFSIRPITFAISSTNATNTAKTSTPIFKAGSDTFNLTATAIAGYNGTPLIDSTKLIGTPTAGSISGVFGTATLATGIAIGNAFTYSEVGNLGMDENAVYDGNFTEIDQPNDCTNDFSTSLVGGKYGCKIGSQPVAQTTGSSGFGRFVPDHFDVTLSEQQNCNNFVYAGRSATALGQPFAAQVKARNGAGNITENYTYASGYAKSVNLSISSGGGTLYVDSTAGGTGAVPSSKFANTTACGNLNTVTSGGIGTVCYTDTSGKLSYVFDTFPTTETTFTLHAEDADTAPSTGIDGSIKARSGRLRVQNAYGSELLNLPISLEAQYWNGTSYVRNQLDNCTSIPANTISMGNYKNNLNACETQIGYNSGSGTLTNGVSNFLRLTAPGAGNSGSVDLIVNLNSASGNTCTPASAAAGNANMPWFGANPALRATFGIYKTPIIHLRENY